MKSYRLNIKGRVQGVWFRQSALDYANKLGISGTIRNVDDGSVEIFIQGQDQEIDKFIEWCKIGPSQAEVTGIKIIEVEPENFEGFKII